MLKENLEGATILVAGARGLVGSAIVRRLQAEGSSHLLLPDSKALDLRNQTAVNGFFKIGRPDYVFLAAAKVGGIHANSTYPADFIRDNLQIQTNIIDAAYRNGAKKLLFLGSSCIYPKLAPQPIKEEYLLTSALEETNEWYAIAKISGIKMCQAYRKQYGFNAISAMPTNLYGPGDNFHPENSHVVPALMRRFHEAKENGSPSVSIWGTGTAKREFLYVDDLAGALVFLMRCYNAAEWINIGSGQEVSIHELAHIMAEVTGFTGRIEFNTNYPDGAPRKLLDVGKLNGLGWRAETGLRDGLTREYGWYCENVAKTAQGTIG